MASSNGGTILPPAESRDLAEWNQLDDSDRDEEQEVGRKGRWKGKSKMADFGADDPEIGISTRMTSSMDDERGAGNESGRSYPPLSEEAAEERAVIENLKRWETAERLRRKAVRESRALSTSSTPSPLAELGRRASLLLFRRSTGSNRGGATILRSESPTTLDDIEQQHNPHRLVRTETDDTTRNPFRDPAAAASDAALVSPKSANPFQPDVASRGRERADSTSTITGGTTPVQPTPQKPLGSAFFIEENGAHVPAPRPLDLPTTPAPQHIYVGGGAVPAKMSGPGEGMRIRRTLVETREEEEELERERIEGRWWTDWLCGLKEKRDPAGQNHKGPVHVATYAKGEAKYVLTGGQDRTIRLWNPDSGTEIKKYEGHGYEVLGISVAHDNSRFASGGGDRSVFLWNVTTGTTERRMPGHLGKINAVAFNVDESVLASAYGKRAQNRTPIQVLDEARDSITCLHIGSTEIISGSVDGHVRTYDLRMGELKSDFIGRHLSNDYRTHACFGHGEGSVVCGDEQGKIWEWDLIDAKVASPDPPPRVHDKVITWVEHHPLVAGEIISASADASHGTLSQNNTNIPLETAAPYHGGEMASQFPSYQSFDGVQQQSRSNSLNQDIQDGCSASVRNLPGSSVSERSSSRSGTIEVDSRIEGIDQSTVESNSLPPPDRGPQAWLYLLGAFVVETLIWGFPNSFGVFLSYYSKKFDGEVGAKLLLPLAGTLCSGTLRSTLNLPFVHGFTPSKPGLMYCSGPILYPIVARYPSHHRTSMWAGNFFCPGSLFGASFANKRVVYVGVVFCSARSGKWSDERRSVSPHSPPPPQLILTMAKGTAVGGLVLPLILPSIIRPQGTTITLRYLSIAIFVLLSSVLPFVRPRLPEDRIHTLAANSRTSWSTNTSFWLLLFVTALQGLAYFLPVIYIPTFAQDMMLSDNQASLAVALLNGSSVVSRVSLGHLSDIFNPWVLTMFTLAAASVITFVLWGVVVTIIATPSLYALLFGALAGGFSSLWTGFVRPIAKDDTTAATSMLGMLMLSRGLGNVLSTPISSVLISGPMLDHVQLGLQKGSRWASLIIYVGTLFAGGTVVGIIGWLRENKSALAR
ncbi:Mitogen-activated protein kinase organizer 1 [Ceratobasidium theobromae]|uniref:Mitogen-activated protein kinase organizer 1 n=1 Tax=Ceratobasidium theobromae TaxID=1582974 RepID=A0A5N5QXV5_9AGAM|nr:Mitogen-activated protein kinase organizer 1 [Ceratobasidium theobromae]